MVIFFRAVILYVFVIISMRIMGKRQIGELQPYELVTAIMLSELAALPMQDIGIPLIHGIIPIITLIILEVLCSYLTLKFQPLRKVMCGVPSIIIKEGKIIESELRKQRFNLDDLMEELRLMGYIDLADIEYAIMETSGKLSIVPVYSKTPVTKEDLKLVGDDPTLPISIILDGKINHHNLKIAGYDEKWIYKKLQENEIEDPNDVLVAIIDSTRKLYIQKRGEEDEGKH
ncbi:DUF421 domain-containing protein [Clostridium cylindrosporum]|uniref:Membrane protein n=1 Tax=Clostridium cylindrosporum DSM 605 TaxID=1121307 RepID=A0A0J8D4V5_CLOCY|nr:DUF421 domain-containing protein [Clostridium cylindrosporum]KMT20847.1 membrane protein [Clostridium cylindrosporum DSM 605]